MKKTLICILIIISIGFSAHADTKTYLNHSQPLDYTAFEYMTRADCIIYVMKAAGGIDMYMKAIGRERIFNVMPHETAAENDESYKLNHRAEKFDGIFENYLDVAVNLEPQIVYGDNIKDDVVFVDALSYATIEEALAFMVRFLKNVNNDDLRDLNKTFQIAEERGLLSKEDDFYHNSSSKITVPVFRLLLERFVRQPRYLYCKGKIDNEDFCTQEDFICDESESMTYFEYLNVLGITKECFDFSHYEYITNNDAISYIMKAIGTPEDKYREQHEISVRYWHITWEDRYEVDRALEFTRKCYFDSGTDYVETAIVNTNIVNGKYYNPPGMPDYFDVVKYASAREVISYMMRCLYGNFDIDLTDSEFLFEKAKEISLVCAEDSFYDNCEKLLTIVEFQKIMERFLSQPVNLYCDGTDFDFLA